MRVSRRQAHDQRTGRRPDGQQIVDDAGATAAAYTLLVPRLAQLRATIAADDRADRPMADVRRDHAALEGTLAEAADLAFAADARRAPTPAGITSWMAEGLARSTERELAMLAASDVSGVIQVTTAAIETA